MRKRRNAEPKPKSVAYRFIPPESEVGEHMYALLRTLVNEYHRDVIGARIALAWNVVWKPDVDGRVILGQCRKVSDLEREVNELLPYDFVIVLRKEFWQDPCVTDLQRRALLDHELCHAAVKLDEHGEPVVDERERTVYRIRKHDLEEFAEIAERYGCYKRDVEEFAKRLDRARHKTKGRWIGYEQLQQQLREAGLHVSLDAIVTWTETQRREATVWADVRMSSSGMGLEFTPTFLLEASAPLQPSNVLPANTFSPVPPAPGDITANDEPHQ